MRVIEGHSAFAARFDFADAPGLIRYFNLSSLPLALPPTRPRLSSFDTMYID